MNTPYTGPFEMLSRAGFLLDCLGKSRGTGYLTVLQRMLVHQERAATLRAYWHYMDHTELQQPAYRVPRHIEIILERINND